MNKIEKIAYEQLKKEGYQIAKAVNQLIKTKKGYISLHHDLWGLWDFCAINQNHIRFIQVSSRYMTQRPKVDQERMLSFPKPSEKYFSKEFWRWDTKAKEFIKEIL